MTFVGNNMNFTQSNSVNKAEIMNPILRISYYV